MQQLADHGHGDHDRFLADDARQADGAGDAGDQFGRVAACLQAVLEGGALGARADQAHPGAALANILAAQQRIDDGQVQIMAVREHQMQAGWRRVGHFGSGILGGNAMNVRWQSSQFVPHGQAERGFVPGQSLR